MLTLQCLRLHSGTLHALLQMVNAKMSCLLRIKNKLQYSNNDSVSSNAVYFLKKQKRFDYDYNLTICLKFSKNNRVGIQVILV